MSETGIFRRILAPTDGSDYSIAAGRLAISLARVHNARCYFLYVVDKLVLSELTRFGGKGELDARRELEETGRRALTYLERQAATWSLPVETMIREGTPHIEIIAVAKSSAIDLIVIGQVGLRGPRRLLIGSVAERVIEYAECPVLIAKKQ